MKKNTFMTVVCVIAAIAAVVGAVVGVLYWLDRKGILQLQKTNYEYAEEFPDLDE